MSRKLTYEFVKGVFKEQGCELLETEYKNNNTKMRYRCSCGNKSKIIFNNFKKGQRCQKCKSKKLANERKYIYEFVYNYFEEHGCKLLETNYKNNFTKMRYICDCGDIREISFACFKRGERCMKCAKEKAGNRYKHTYEYMYNCFKEQKCELLEKKYKNNRTLLKYICSCGNKSKISFSNFKKGQRCKKCMIEKISGENNWNYDPNLTDEDRIDRRLIPGYKAWVKNTYKNDNYICQKCRTRKDNRKKYKKLNAHHIFNYSTNKKLRIDISNGITLCEDCHKEFHKIYSKKNNTKYQLDEFLKINILIFNH